MSADRDKAFEELGRELARQVAGPSLEEHVDSAEEKLDDDDLVAFALVAIRNGEDGVQAASQRCVDPEVVIESDREGEEIIDALHMKLVDVFESEVADQ